MNKVQIARIEVQPISTCTLACVGCQHASPQRPREMISAAACRDDLARLWEFASFSSIFVGGGEPLLRPDLAGFLDAVHDGPWGASRPDLITNGFWLLRPDYLAFSADVLSRVAVLIVSRYPDYVLRLGVPEWDRRLDAIRAAHPGLIVTSFHGRDPRDLTFTQNGYGSTPAPIVAECSMRRCLQLLPDGTVAKCPLGRGLDLIPNATPEFLASYRAHSLYDLARGGEGFAAFVAPEYHPACGLCGIATGDRWDVPWKSDPRVRTARGSDYLEIIQAPA